MDPTEGCGLPSAGAREDWVMLPVSRARGGAGAPKAEVVTGSGATRSLRSGTRGAAGCIPSDSQPLLNHG
ncbi:hypothetical protein GCM10009544_11680 [Streptomyces stramineus]|uniref:Uncharacterized protein n=1 Tax=Streptomyces stramineus TaxID=173861 RepID=A0ABP3JDU6_9ACTN